MKILFDLISTQEYHSGGGEYVEKVLKELLSYEGCRIWGLYDSRLLFLLDDLEKLKSQIALLDISKATISEWINTYNIDVFFIGIAQKYVNYNISNIECKTICVIHDIGDMEFFDNRIHFLSPCSLKNYIRLSLDYWLPNVRYSTICRALKRYRKLESLLLQDNVTLVTVSEYTSNSIIYYFPKIGNRKTIHVLYPPPKQYVREDTIDNEKLKKIFAEKKKYILFVNANRENKNFNILLKCFDKLKECFPDMLLIATGVNTKLLNQNIISLDYVSISDIENLYMHAWGLIYPSLTEGFGYPPVEAMKYGTPVIASNVCSMPEVLGNSALYCSPFYANDLFNCIRLLEKKYQYYELKSEERYQKVFKKQQSDFHKLINMIINEGEDWNS